MSKSGRTVVRMPKALHERLAAEAKEQGVSMNQYIVSVLSGGDRAPYEIAADWEADFVPTGEGGFRIENMRPVEGQ